MLHKIPIEDTKKHTKGISESRRTQVSNLQNHIQEILGDSHHTFLQGSYKNGTSTSDINDVDIAAVRVNTYSGTYSPKPFSNTIAWENIFEEIEKKLRSQKLYVWTVERKDKCIQVVTRDFKADVVPATQVQEDIGTDPIAIYSFKNRSEKINSPRNHYENGVSKNKETSNNYKPIVRLFKNWLTNHFGNKRPISSYQIESLIYNTPSENFSDDHASSFILIGLHIKEMLSSIHAFSPKINSVCGTENIIINWSEIDRGIFKKQLEESLTTALKAYKSTTASEAKYYWDKAFNL